MLVAALQLARALAHRHGDEPCRAAEGGRIDAEGGPAEAPEPPFRQAIERLLSQAPPLHPPGALPLPLHRCTCTWVCTPQQLTSLAAALGRLQRFALDVEHHSIHLYAGVTCLLQISTGGRAQQKHAVRQSFPAVPRCHELRARVRACQAAL